MVLTNFSFALRYLPLTTCPTLVPTYIIALFVHVLPSYVDLLGNTWIRFALVHLSMLPKLFFCDIPPKLAFLRNYGRYTSAVFGQVLPFLRRYT